MELKMTFNSSRFEEFHLVDVDHLNTRVGHYGGVMVPTNYEDLRRDPIYIYHLRSLHRVHEYLTEFYGMIKRQTEHMIELIEEEFQTRT